MSEKEPKKRQHAAVLKIYPSSEAIEWLKANCTKDWRSYAEGKLAEHLEFLADGDRFARIHAGAVDGFATADAQSVLSAAEAAGLKRAAEIRAEKRREALLSGYTKEELEAALAEARTWTGEPKLDPALSAERRQAADDYLEMLNAERLQAANAAVRDDEPAPAPPKKGTP